MNKKLSILVIDDDNDVRQLVCDYLQQAGFFVCQAENGNQGLAHLQAQPLPDLIVTDILMPEREGLETIIAVRRTYPKMKLIAISGSYSRHKSSFLSIAKKLGADVVLPKPVDLDLLLEKVNLLLGRKRRIQNLDTPAAAQGPIQIHQGR